MKKYFVYKKISRRYFIKARALRKKLNFENYNMFIEVEQ